MKRLKTVYNKHKHTDDELYNRHEMNKAHDSFSLY